MDEDLRLTREQAAVYREMAPLLDRLQKLVTRRGWPLGRNVLQCAVEELERLTPRAAPAKTCLACGKRFSPIVRSVVYCGCNGRRLADDP